MMEVTEAVQACVVETADGTAAVGDANVTDTVGGWETGDTGAVGGAGLALAAW